MQEQYEQRLLITQRLLVKQWVAYCQRPSAEALRAFSKLQESLTQAVVHAREQNYQKALSLLPSTYGGTR